VCVGKALIKAPLQACFFVMLFTGMQNNNNNNNVVLWIQLFVRRI
jgi:hypothetical protein